jgi:general secretion pathway protein K
MTPTERGDRRDRRRGIALLLVMWVFMILGVLALDFARFMREDAMAAVNLSDETRGYYIALAGMNRALWSVIASREGNGGQPNASGTGQPGQKTGQPGHKMKKTFEESDEDVEFPVDGQWHDGTFGGGRFQVRLTDEGGLVSINQADETLLTRLISALLTGPNSQVQGQDRRTADQVAGIVDSILDWRDTDNLKRTHGAESEYYLGLRPPYRAKNGRFDSPEELLRVKGVTPELFYGVNGMPGLRDLISVFPRKDKGVNARTAPPELIALLLGKDPSTAPEIAAARGNDAGFLPSILIDVVTAGIPLDTFSNHPPQIVRVTARADVSHERDRSTVEAVVDLSGEDLEGPKVLRWLDRAPWTGGLPTDLPALQGATS